MQEPNEHPQKAARLGWILRSQEEPLSRSTRKPQVLEGAPESPNTEPLSGLRTPAWPAGSLHRAHWHISKGFSTARACQAHQGADKSPCYLREGSPYSQGSYLREAHSKWEKPGGRTVEFLAPPPTHQWTREARDLPFWVSASSAVLPTAS